MKHFWMNEQKQRTDVNRPPIQLSFFLQLSLWEWESWLKERKSWRAVGGTRRKQSINSISLMINEMSELMWLIEGWRPTAALLIEWKKVELLFLMNGGLRAAAAARLRQEEKTNKQLNQLNEINQRKRVQMGWWWRERPFFQFIEWRKRTSPNPSSGAPTSFARRQAKQTNSSSLLPLREMKSWNCFALGLA